MISDALKEAGSGVIEVRRIDVGGVVVCCVVVIVWLVCGHYTVIVELMDYCHKQ